MWLVDQGTTTWAWCLFPNFVEGSLNRVLGRDLSIRKFHLELESFIMHKKNIFTP